MQNYVLVSYITTRDPIFQPETVYFNQKPHISTIETLYFNHRDRVFQPETPYFNKGARV